MKRARSYVLNAGIAGVALYYACRLSQGDRGLIDWIVIAAVSGALLFNLVRLGFRLFRAGGFKAVWHLQRTLLFWIIGLFNTLLARPADIGGWKNVLGWLLIALALADSVAIYRKERAASPLAPRHPVE